MSEYAREHEAQRQIAVAAAQEHDIVTRVRRGAIKANPELVGDVTLPGRLAQAHAEAKRMGITRAKLVAKFLLVEARVPNFYRHPEISVWLEDGGPPADDRFEDLLAVTRKWLEENQVGR